MITATRTRVDDVTVMVGGQGGDGSLTIVALLARLLAARGFHLYQSRNVRSRIKGGPVAGFLRATAAPRHCIDDTVDLAMVFDDESLPIAARLTAPGSVVVVDASFGPPPTGIFGPGVEIIPVPFGRLAVRELRRDLFKNSVAFGIATRLLSIPDHEAERVLGDRFRHLSGPGAAANIAAARRGFELAAEHGLDRRGAWELSTPERRDRLFITGNEAVAFGFMAAGGRFFAGYPITPATEILEWLDRHLPGTGGIVVQAEDELAAVNMALGAALTGTRAMTATSGPGISLMQEGVSHAGSAEIPIVVVDCQRAGPSTGMPTKPEQSDLHMLALGANGDFPRIVLAPTGPADAFTLTIEAVNLSQELQCPVYLALDQAIAQNAETLEPFDLDRVEIAEGKRIDASELPGAYRRYEISEDGVSPWSIPGDPGGISLVTGNEHDAWGHVSADPLNRAAMIDKRARKLQSAAGRLPRGDRLGDSDASVGLIGLGMEAGALEEAAERLAALGLPVAGLIPKTVWPLTTDTIEFLAARDRTYVVEHNAGAQLAGLLRHGGVPSERLRSMLRYDGVPFAPADLAGRILEAESA